MEFINFIIYSWAWPAMACQNVLCENTIIAYVII